MKIRGSILGNARMIVVENVNAPVGLVSVSANSIVPRAEVTIRDIFGDGAACGLSGHGFPAPGSILPVGGDNHPLFPQWMPALLPFRSAVHGSQILKELAKIRQSTAI